MQFLCCFLLSCPLMVLSGFIQQSLAADDVNHSLLKEVRAWTSAYSSSLLNTDISCDGLIYGILENYNCTVDFGSGHNGLPPSLSPELPLIFKWPITVSKTIRCYCALSVFQLMISRDLDSNKDAFCTQSSTFTCDDSDCEYYIANQTNTPNYMYENKCLVRATSSERYTATQLKTANVSVVAIFNGLSCDVIRDYEEDICDVVYNINAGTTELPTSTEGSTVTNYTATTLLIGGAVVFFIILIVSLFILCFAFGRCSRKTRINPDSSQPIDSKRIESQDKYSRSAVSIFNRPTAEHGTKVSNRLLLSCWIEPSSLRLVNKVGQGEFGIVYRGLLTKYNENNQFASVAVKTLKGSYSQTQTDQLIIEAEKMMFFDHFNVLSLTGVCVGLLESPCLVMPFMSNGSLLSYLRKEAHNLTVSESAEENLLLDTMKQLLSMCLQVAKGMAYLAEQKFVHRDLAARNCMISSDGVIKVADFGLAEDVYSTMYFKQDVESDKHVKLPIKWMALESIHYGKFSEKTDVVFSVGKTPYPGMSPKEVVSMLDSGERLDQPLTPTCTSKEVYSLMLSCWNHSPDDRPCFSELVEMVDKELSSMAGYLDFKNIHFIL